MLKRVQTKYKYNCDCPYVVSKNTGKRKKDSGGRFLRDHNYITPSTMKKFQTRTSCTLMNNKSVSVVKRKIRGVVKHLFGKCEPGDGCTHATEFVHKNPINCPQMIKAIKKYVENEIIRIKRQTKNFGMLISILVFLGTYIYDFVCFQYITTLKSYKFFVNLLCCELCGFLHN